MGTADRTLERVTPALDALVELPAGRYVLGEPGEEREVELGARADRPLSRLQRAPGRNAASSSPTTPPPTSRARRRRRSRVAQRPASDRRRVGGARPRRRRPRLSVGRDVRRDPLQLRRGAVGLDRPGHRAPARREPLRRRAARRQRLGVGVRPHARRLGRRQGRLLPRHRLGAAGSRTQEADPARATRTTGFRIAVDPGRTA